MSCRALLPDELGKWTEFCAHCFSEKVKPPSPQYFMDHFRNDPWRDQTLIFVTEEGDSFSSTLRMFSRSIHNELESESKSIVGLGEVCTAPKFRRKGLSKALLNHAVNIATQRKYHKIMLHAAEWIQPLYRSIGFESLSTVWSEMLVSKKEIEEIRMTMNNNYSISYVSVISNSDRLVEISNSFNSHFSGPIIRENEYMSKWISQACDDNIIGLADESGVIIAYSLIKEYPIGYMQLADFGCCEKNIHKLDNILLLLISEGVLQSERLSSQEKQVTDNLDKTIEKNNLPIEKDIHIRIPQPVYELAKLKMNTYNDNQYVFPVVSEVYIDSGWMQLKLSHSSEKGRQSKVSVKESLTALPHEPYMTTPPLPPLANMQYSNNIIDGNSLKSFEGNCNKERVFWPVDHF